MSEIKKEVSEAYNTAREFPAPSPIATLCDALQQAEARAMKAGWWHLSRRNPFTDKFDCCDGERHNWTNVDWLRAADARLRGDG